MKIPIEILNSVDTNINCNKIPVLPVLNFDLTSSVKAVDLIFDNNLSLVKYLEELVEFKSETLKSKLNTLNTDYSDIINTKFNLVDSSKLLPLSDSISSIIAFLLGYLYELDANTKLYIKHYQVLNTEYENNLDKIKSIRYTLLLDESNNLISDLLRFKNLASTLYNQALLMSTLDYDDLLLNAYNTLIDNLLPVIKSLDDVFCKYEVLKDAMDTYTKKFQNLYEKSSKQYLDILNSAYIRGSENVKVSKTADRKLMVSAYAPELPKCPEFKAFWNAPEVKLNAAPPSSCPPAPDTTSGTHTESLDTDNELGL